MTTSSSGSLTGEHKKVLAAALVGTSIEWYDYFIYAQAAGLVLGPLFLGPYQKQNPSAAQIIAFATIGLAFLFRPLGAIISGHLGDRVGRKIMLILTLILMGAATALIGVLPTYAQAGVWAPILLIILRIAQGFSAGGEWGGAALMSVEHAPVNKRSFFGSFPGIGTPVGMIVATLVLLVFEGIMSPDAFLAWGWRLPFLFSIVLIVVGLVIRRSVEESPVFVQMQERRKQSTAPLGVLFARNTKEVVLAALSFMANNAAGYLLIAFFISYGQKTLHIAPPTMLTVAVASAVSWLVFTIIGGIMGDAIGKVRTFQIGYAILFVWAIPMWFLIDTGNPFLFFVAAAIMAAGLGLSYGPQAALFAEQFPAAVRYSGVSISYALGSILGGAFAATIAQWIISTYTQSWGIGVYIAILTVISFVATSMMNKPAGIDLGVSGVDEQPIGLRPTRA